MNYISLSQPQAPRFSWWKMLLLAFVCILSACNLPFYSMQPGSATEDAAAPSTQTSSDLGQSLPDTPLSPIVSAPIVHVTTETNCRSGPDKQYDRLGVLLVGETAEVVGKRTIANYWVIQNPDASGTCWLWGMYATVEGNTDLLPEMTPPPTPTPLPPTDTVPPYADFTLTFLNVCNPTTDPFAIFRVTNTGTMTLHSAQASIVDTTASTMMYGPGTSDTPFRNTDHCDDWVLVSSVDPGNTLYMRYGLHNEVAGHNVQATIKLCSQDGLLGSCVTRVVNFVFP